MDSGEPLTVRMIYFVSDPQRFRQEVVDKMKTTIQEVQRIFADQIRAHGFGEKTLRFERDTQGEPMVHIVYGVGGTYDHWGALERIQQKYDLNSNECVGNRGRFERAFRQHKCLLDISQIPFWPLRLLIETKHRGYFKCLA